MADDNIQVELAYAHNSKEQVILSVLVPVSSTIKQVILRSNIMALFPSLDLNTMVVGIFGHKQNLQDVVKPGDRVEIYRSLVIDPKAARRQAALEK